MTSFAEFIGKTDTRAFAPGEVIFNEGDRADGQLYALLEGSVEIVRQNTLLEEVPEGGVFGELALIDNLPRSATAQAKTAGRLAVISDERFRELVLRNPSFALEIMRLMARRMRRNLGA